MASLKERQESFFFQLATRAPNQWGKRNSFFQKTIQQYYEQPEECIAINNNNNNNKQLFQLQPRQPTKNNNNNNNNSNSTQNINNNNNNVQAIRRLIRLRPEYPTHLLHVMEDTCLCEIQALRKLLRDNNYKDTSNNNTTTSHTPHDSSLFSYAAIPRQLAQQQQFVTQTKRHMRAFQRVLRAIHTLLHIYQQLEEVCQDNNNNNHNHIVSILLLHDTSTSTTKTKTRHPRDPSQEEQDSEEDDSQEETDEEGYYDHAGDDYYYHNHHQQESDEDDSTASQRTACHDMYRNKHNKHNSRYEQRQKKSVAASRRRLQRQADKEVQDVLRDFRVQTKALQNAQEQLATIVYQMDALPWTNKEEQEEEADEHQHSYHPQSCESIEDGQVPMTSGWNDVDHLSLYDPVVDRAFGSDEKLMTTPQRRRRHENRTKQKKKESRQKQSKQKKKLKKNRKQPNSSSKRQHRNHAPPPPPNYNVDSSSSSSEDETADKDETKHNAIDDIFDQMLSPHPRKQEYRLRCNARVAMLSTFDWRHEPNARNHMDDPITAMHQTYPEGIVDVSEEEVEDLEALWHKYHWCIQLSEGYRILEKPREKALVDDWLKTIQDLIHIKDKISDRVDRDKLPDMDEIRWQRKKRLCEIQFVEAYVRVTEKVFGLCVLTKPRFEQSDFVVEAMAAMLSTNDDGNDKGRRRKKVKKSLKKTSHKQKPCNVHLLDDLLDEMKEKNEELKEKEQENAALSSDNGSKGKAKDKKSRQDKKRKHTKNDPDSKKKRQKKDHRSPRNSRETRVAAGRGGKSNQRNEASCVGRAASSTSSSDGRAGDNKHQSSDAKEESRTNNGGGSREHHSRSRPAQPKYPKPVANPHRAMKGKNLALHKLRRKAKRIPTPKVLDERDFAEIAARGRMAARESNRAPTPNVGPERPPTAPAAKVRAPKKQNSVAKARPTPKNPRGASENQNSTRASVQHAPPEKDNPYRVKVFEDDKPQKKRKRFRRRIYEEDILKSRCPYEL